MKTILLWAAALILAGCVQSGERSGVPQGRIVDLHSGKTLTPYQLAAALGSQARLIVGEKHDNPQHHRIEQWLLASLMAQRAQGSVLLEMITPSQQAGVDAVQAELKRGKTLSDARIIKLTDWQKGWPWSLYAGVVTTALSGNYPVLAANLDRAEIKSEYQNPRPLEGALSAQPQVRQTLLETIRASHDNQLDEKQAQAMLVIQQRRDRRMAERLAAAPTPALLIAGAYHADRALGVPLHLTDIAPQAALTVVILAEQGATVSRHNADYVWYTGKAK